MAKTKRTNVKTSSRTITTVNDPLIQSWADTQQTLGSSVSQGIFMSIEEFGYVDLPISLSKTAGQLVSNANIHVESYKEINNVDKIEHDSQKKEPKKKPRTMALIDDDDIQKWLDSQINVSASISQLMALLASHYGIQDLPIAIAKERGQLNKEIFSKLPNLLDEKVKINIEDTNNDKIIPNNLENTETSNEVNDTLTDEKSDGPDLSILHDRDFFNK